MSTTQRKQCWWNHSCRICQSQHSNSSNNVFFQHEHLICQILTMMFPAWHLRLSALLCSIVQHINYLTVHCYGWDVSMCWPAWLPLLCSHKTWRVLLGAIVVMLAVRQGHYSVRHSAVCVRCSISYTAILIKILNFTH